MRRAVVMGGLQSRLDTLSVVFLCDSRLTVGGRLKDTPRSASLTPPPRRLRRHPPGGDASGPAKPVPPHPGLEGTLAERDVSTQNTVEPALPGRWCWPMGGGRRRRRGGA